MPSVASIRIVLIAVAVLIAAPGAARSGPSASVDDGLARRDSVFAAHGMVPPIPSRPVAAPDMPGAPTAQAADPAPADPAPADPAPKVAISDMRLGLMQMALAVGPAGHAQIHAAAPAVDAPALYLREGTATLDDLVALSAEAGHPDALRHAGGTYTASMPIIVLRGAALALRDGETLAFAGEGVGFLLSFGTLSVTGATVLAGGAPQDGGFRPFVASIGGGGIMVRDSRFVGLGFGPAPALSGLSIASAGLYASGAPSVVVRSRFEDLGGISVMGSDRVVIAGNRIAEARHTAIRVEASDHATVSRNVVTGTRGGYALRLGGPGRAGTVRDNVLSGGARAGLRLDAAIAETAISGNLIEDFRAEGVAVLQGARCVWLHGNVIRANGGNAVRAAAAADLVVTGNIVLANGGTGLALTEGLEGTSALVAGNTFAGNRAGIHSATRGRLQLSGNDLSGQLPRLVTGDLAQHTALLLHQMRAGGTADLEIRRVSASPLAEPAGADAGARAFAACQRGEGG